MGVLTRPDLPPGTGRDLVEALHDLHHRAGRPSLRSIAGYVGCSPTTVSAVFSSPRLPTWGVLELVVESLGGDVEMFRTLWLAADAAEGGGSPGSLVPVAGRKDELRAVRLHLVGGRGLLLVTGEAGIGKSHLVRAATAAVDGEVFVAKGACLPLSAAVPVLPVSDALRAVHDVDGGRWLGEALAGTAPYVTEALVPLLPELEAAPQHTPQEDAWSRHRMSLAVGAVLAALADLRPLAVVVEDLHWADPATLDMLEHLLARGPAVPVVGSWRTDDPTTAQATLDWFQRVTRLPDVDALPLGPLSEDETAEQLALLGVSTATAGLIHRRSAGQPLFTEQLAAQPVGAPMPSLLADLLDRRLADLDGPAWRVARTLGVADRSLDDRILADAAGVTGTELSGALHELADRRLLRVGSTRLVEVHHPLLAEAIRRRLVPGELADEHRRLAEGLGRRPDVSPAEVAEHWQRAGVPAEELTWRVAAARAAAQRYALAQAADQWLRVLSLWPDGLLEAGDPPIRKPEVYDAAMEILCFLDVLTGWQVAEAALRDLSDPSDPAAAGTFRRAAYIRCWLGDPDGALSLVDRAIALHEGRPPSPAYVDALHVRDQILDALGRYEEARATSARAREMAAGLDIPTTYRNILIREAIHQSDVGHADRALALLGEAAPRAGDRPDPGADIHLAVTRTAVLTDMGRPVEEVLAAGTSGLEAAAAWGIETRPVLMIRANMAAALRLSGQVGRAAALIDPLISDDPPTPETSCVHAERACVDVLRGRCADALSRFTALADFRDGLISNRLEDVRYDSDALLWCGQHDRALALLTEVLQDGLPTDAAIMAGGPLVLAARATADLAERSATTDRLSCARELRRLLGRARSSPFAERPTHAAGPAEGTTWAAELARLTQDATVEQWTRAAAAWDRLHRPHDAAYCRWRGAQVALREGRATLGGRLLRRAATDAREHVPLSRAIEATGLART
ncbi:ATP-binding protein [Nocardioides guangzhouensis]|nr:AAA family ATPase [Nocardioides guangzhouensis]